MKRAKWKPWLGLCALLAGVIGWYLWPHAVAPDQAAGGEEGVADSSPLVELTPLPAMPAPVLKPAPVATPAKPDRLREDGSQQLETPWQAAEVGADFPLAEPGDAVGRLEAVSVGRRVEPGHDEQAVGFQDLLEHSPVARLENMQGQECLGEKRHVGQRDRGHDCR